MVIFEFRIDLDNGLYCKGFGSFFIVFRSFLLIVMVLIREYGWRLESVLDILLSVLVS